MREILFRGKIKGNGEWIEGYLLHLVDSYDHMVIIPTNSYLIGGDEFTGIGEIEWVIPETVGQYTGSKDKNEKPIFEGDIVNFKCKDCYHGNYTGVVVFKDSCFQIECDLWAAAIGKLFRLPDGKRYHKFGEFEKWEDMGVDGDVRYNYHVVGNIHDNPELLEEVKL